MGKKEEKNTKKGGRGLWISRAYYCMVIVIVEYNGRDKVTTDIGETDREGDSTPTGVAKHSRQLQQSCQRHSQARRRCSPRQFL